MRLKSVIFGENRFELSPENYEIPQHIHNERLTEPFISVLIGPNASGKSRCLSKIADAFRKLNDKRTGKKLDTPFTLSYESEGLENVINSESYDQEQIQLPDRVISISNSLSDKFPLKAKISDLDFYEYIGSRDSGLDKEKYAVYALVDTLQEIGINDAHTRKTKEVFEYLGLVPQIWIKFKRNKGSNSKVFELLFSGANDNQLRESLISNPRFKRLSNGHQSEIQRNLSNEEYLRGLRDFIRDNRETLINDNVTSFHLSFSKPEGLSDFQRYYKFFTLLRKFNILSYDSIEVKKKENNVKYNLLDSSSGELNLLTTFVRTIPHLCNNALILIDEPEISLHPNWQIQYIEKLKELLDGYFDCHVIVATHSPYIVSDVEPGMCWLSQIKSENGFYGSNVLDEKPYGWSVEDILWNIFKVPTTRNYYLSDMMGDVLKVFSKPDKTMMEIQELKNKKEELESIRNRLKVIDPLRKVIDVVLEKI